MLSHYSKSARKEFKHTTNRPNSKFSEKNFALPPLKNQHGTLKLWFPKQGSPFLGKPPHVQVLIAVSCWYLVNFIYNPYIGRL